MREKKRNELEAKAAGVAIPGFPEIVAIDRRCRVCSIVETKPELVESIHSLKRDGMTDYELQQATTELLQGWEEEPIDRMVYGRHFANHVKVEWIGRSAIVRRDGPSEDHYDYFQMWELYDRLRPILSRMYHSIVTANPKVPIKSYDLTMLTKLFSECRQILKALNDMRNSDRLTKSILEAHTQHMARAFVGPLGEKIRHAAGLLRGGADVEDVADFIDNLVADEIPTILTRARGAALQKSFEEFKLH